MSVAIDSAIASITSAEIKAVSKSWTSIICDWTPGIIGGGITLAGIMFFAAKAFTGTGETALIDMEKVLF